MNELDQFVKHKLKVKYYIRYADDFVIVSNNTEYLQEKLVEIRSFLKDKLKLELHPNKVSIRKVRQGVDFLGYVLLPHHRQIITKTKRRIFRKLEQRIYQYKIGRIEEATLNQSLSSFMGVLSHADTHKLQAELMEKYQLWSK